MKSKWQKREEAIERLQRRIDKMKEEGWDDKSPQVQSCIHQINDNIKADIRKGRGR